MLVCASGAFLASRCAVNGASEQARTLVARCVATENDPELKQDFEQTLGRIEDQITIDLRRHQKREDP